MIEVSKPYSYGSHGLCVQLRNRRSSVQELFAEHVLFEGPTVTLHVAAVVELCKKLQKAVRQVANKQLGPEAPFSLKE